MIAVPSILIILIYGMKSCFHIWAVSISPAAYAVVMICGLKSCFHTLCLLYAKPENFIGIQAIVY